MSPTMSLPTTKLPAKASVTSLEGAPRAPFRTSTLRTREASMGVGFGTTCRSLGTVVMTRIPSGSVLGSAREATSQLEQDKPIAPSSCGTRISRFTKAEAHDFGPQNCLQPQSLRSSPAHGACVASAVADTAFHAAKVPSTDPSHPLLHRPLDLLDTRADVRCCLGVGSLRT